MKDFCQVLICATSREEAHIFSDSLVKEKLAVSSLILSGNSRYWTEGQVIEKPYWNVQAFSQMQNKEAIISLIKKLGVEDSPIIAFFPMQENQGFLDWMDRAVGQ